MSEYADETDGSGVETTPALGGPPPPQGSGPTGGFTDTPVEVLVAGEVETPVSVLLPVTDGRETPEGFLHPRTQGNPNPSADYYPECHPINDLLVLTREKKHKGPGESDGPWKRSGVRTVVDRSPTRRVDRVATGLGPFPL